LFTSIFCLCLSTHLIILLIFVISLTFVLNISHTHILQFILYLPSQSISPPCSWYLSRHPLLSFTPVYPTVSTSR
jgi:hypothetical protein